MDRIEKRVTISKHPMPGKSCAQHLGSDENGGAGQGLWSAGRGGVQSHIPPAARAKASHEEACKARKGIDAELPITRTSRGIRKCEVYNKPGQFEQSKNTTDRTIREQEPEKGSDVRGNVQLEACVPRLSHHANKQSAYARNFIAAPAS